MSYTYNKPDADEPVWVQIERADFENWVVESGGSIDRRKPGEYRSNVTECAWGAWISRAIKYMRDEPKIWSITNAKG